MMREVGNAALALQIAFPPIDGLLELLVRILGLVILLINTYLAWRRAQRG